MNEAMQFNATPKQSHWHRAEFIPPKWDEMKKRAVIVVKQYCNLHTEWKIHNNIHC